MRISLFLSMIILVIASGCKTGKEASSAQTGDAVTTGQKSDTLLSPDTGKEWFGREIVSETVSRLSRRLEADNETTVRIKTVVAQTFVSAGYEYQKKYPDTEAKKIAKEIVKGSAPSLNSVLSNQQQRILKKMVSD